MDWLPLSLVLASLSSLIGCTVAESMEPERPEPAVQAVEAEPPATEPAEGPELFFAVLGQTGIEHCADGSYDPSWLDVQATLGFVPAGGAAEGLDALMDQPVLARGRSISAPPRPPLGIEPQPCPMMQMRSDWINTPRGIRVQRGSSPAIEHFHATSVRRLDELKLERDGDELLVTFSNPLSFALSGVRLVMYYEGCYGKPGTTSRSSEPIELAPGAALSHRFLRIAEDDHPGPRKGGPTAREHRAAALVLELGTQAGPEGAAVYADLAVSLRAFGLEFDCD